MFTPLVMAVTTLIATATVPATSTFRPSVGYAQCVAENAPAAVETAVVPDTPFTAQQTQATGTTYVHVDLDESGAVVQAFVAASSGHRDLDSAAVAATRQTAFRPEIRNCSAVGGSYLYEVNFTE